MSRIRQRFQALQKASRKALIPYITAGDPHPQYTVGLMHALVEGDGYNLADRQVLSAKQLGAESLELKDAYT